MSIKPKPVTDTKIPGTDIPDITKVPAESDAQRKWMSRVAVTTAILATLASLASMFATNHLNQAMISVIEESDQWNFFQAKGMKLAIVESKMDLLPAMGRAVPEEDSAKAKRYASEQEDIKAKAEKFKADAADHRTRQAQLSKASTAFQIAIALCAVALLVKKNVFWVLSLLGAGVGLVFFIMGLLPG